MTDKITTWLVDETGTKALVEGADERDRLLPLGWSETTEPAGDEFVWCRHDGITDPARFPAASLEAWRARGWEPSGPPGSVPAQPLTIAQAEPEPAPEPAKTAASKKETKVNA